MLRHKKDEIDKGDMVAWDVTLDVGIGEVITSKASFYGGRDYLVVDSATKELKLVADEDIIKIDEEDLKRIKELKTRNGRTGKRF